MTIRKTTINIDKETEEMLKKLKDKGYNLTAIVKTAVKLLYENEEQFKRLLTLTNDLEELRSKLIEVRKLLDIINLFDENFKMNLAYIKSTLKEADERIIKLNKLDERKDKLLSMYDQILQKINEELSKKLNTANEKIMKEILLKANEVDNILTKVVTISDNDTVKSLIQEAKLILAQIKRLSRTE